MRRRGKGEKETKEAKEARDQSESVNSHWLTGGWLRISAR